jgi:hypothetical protein
MITLAFFTVLPLWVGWQVEQRNGRPTKVPYDPTKTTLQGAKSNDPTTWGTRFQAEERAKTLPKPCGQGGVGLMFRTVVIGGHDYCVGGIDLDTCLDEDGYLLPWAAEIVQRFNSYCEVSPSGTGVKIFFLYNPATLPNHIRNCQATDDKAGAKGEHDPGIELYLTGRYFTVTDRIVAIDGMAGMSELRVVSVEDLRWLHNFVMSFKAQARDKALLQIEDVRAAFEIIPNDGVGWHDWNTKCMAILAVSEGSDEGFAIFDEWSRKSAKYDAERTAARWQACRRCPPDRLTMGSIIHWVRETLDDPKWLPPSWRGARESFVPPRPEPQWPEALAEAAFHGPAGQVVQAIAPHSEADEVALLVSFLCAFGSVIGRRLHFRVEGDRHYSNIFAVLVGETSKSRKGTSWGRTRKIFERLDSIWLDNCVRGGLSTGEGLIHSCRDAQGKDVGISDKRLLLVEPEFASMLKIMGREGNSLSGVLRDAWDSRGSLAILNKNSPERATGAHISIIGHCTADELRRNLEITECANGFGNRFIFTCVRRSKVLPFGGDMRVLDQALHPLEQTLKQRMEHACISSDDFQKLVSTAPDELTWDRDAKELWKLVYPELSEGKPGMAGAILGRGEAQVLRLSLLYALLDGVRWIGREHLEAALALWKYCEQSVAFIFGQSIGDVVSDTILSALLQAGEQGLSRTEISNLLGRHISSARIERALASLRRLGRAVEEQQPSTGGRPSRVWRIVA